MSDLYDGEDIRMWDAETGQMHKSTLADYQDEEMTQCIEDADVLQSMKGSRGWQMVSTFLTNCIDGYKNKLTYSEDLDKVRRFQEAIKAYENVLIFVDQKIHEGLSFKNQKTPPGEG